MAPGYLSLVLHAHLPFVRHPEYDWALEERWFYEAITESYIPLLWAMENLLRDHVPFRITVSLSPTLLAMLVDPLLQERYVRHLEKLLELAEREVHRTQGTPFAETSQMYQNHFRRVHDTFCRRYHRRLVPAFRALQDSGAVELITTSATHGYLPLMMVQPEAVRAQIAVGVQFYNDLFGRRPPGIWLPECAYTKNLDGILNKFGIRYFFTDSHGLLFASHRPRFGIFAPIYCPSGVAAFGRDIESSKQVWSAREGYPGDPDYREYYRDIGFDLNEDYIGPYIHPDGIRIHTGFKYYRITGPGAHKEPYVPAWARHKAMIHADNFVFNRGHQVRYLQQHMDRPPLIVAPYDAELFGHWWFEGPLWLEHLCRKLTSARSMVAMITPSEYLQRFPCNQVATPCESSWGDKGYHEVWLGSKNSWIYRHLHWAAERMVQLSVEYPNAEGLTRRALNQAARELLLAQASDWAFIMTTGTMVDYAVGRTKSHLLNFKGIWHQLQEDRLEEQWIAALENRHNPFPRLDYRIYHPSHVIH